MASCGACKGRGVKKPVGLGMPAACEDCGGTGDKQATAPSKPKAEYSSRPQVCIYEGRIEGRECYGAKTWDHIVPRRAIIQKITGGRNGLNPDTAKILSAALSDPRDLVGACWGCNMNREGGNPDAQPREEDLPDGFWDFVHQYELEADVPRHLREFAPEATT